MKRSLLMTLLLFVAIAATAEDSYRKITYQTKGEDTYSDGQVVHTNEFYALVWTMTSEFGGFNADVTLENPNDKLLQLTAGAGINEKSMKMGLPSTECLILESQVKNWPMGYLHVVMLDTRNADGTLSDPEEVWEGGQFIGYKPVAINGYTTNTTVAVSAGLQGVKTATEKSPIKIERVSGIPDGSPKNPVVKKLYFEGQGSDRMMVMVVTNTASFLRYTSGDAAFGSSELPKTAGAIPSNGGATATDEITIKVPASSGENGLFRIIRN